MIVLQSVTLRRGARVLLDAANLSLHPGERVGLVGRNGAGKSSLFALLSGRLSEDGGRWSMPPNWRMAQVAQDMPETDQPATDFVVEGDSRLMAARQALAQAEAADDPHAMAHAHTELVDADAYGAPARAQGLLLGLGFAVAELDRPVNSFSGGWRMRLQLARALMCPSDLLLLDEPTNHLDLDALVWLEEWLGRYSGTLLVISHDREFLDAATRVTVHIEAAKLKRYGGNYSAFEELRAQQIRLQEAALARQQTQIAHLQKFIDRFKAKATKAKQAQSRVKALARMERIAPLLAQAEFDFAFSDPAQLPNPMLSLHDVSCGYPGAAPRVILQGVARSVLAGQRIGILGANGQGKSTLVKTLVGELPALAGQVLRGKGLSIGYFAQQELDVLRPDETALQHLTRLARRLQDDGLLAGQSTREQDLRSFLGGFLFAAEAAQQAVGSMSGGEKARLVLALLVWQRPNLLLLDEPTNHLDLLTREALAAALATFEGSVLLVSHDRALLRSACDSFWLVSDGAVEPFEGDLEDYQRHLVDQARLRRAQMQEQKTVIAQAQRAQEATSSIAISSQSRQAAAGAGLAAKAPSRSTQARRLAQAEALLAQAQAEVERLQAELGATQTASELARIGAALHSAQEQLAQAEDAWLALAA